MLQIAVCDDQPRELEILNAYIAEYLATHTLEAEVKKFFHPDKLLTTIETESFHLYILDIVMPMVSSIELGKEIRRLDREAQIIYATTEPQFALQAYAASPIHYLINLAIYHETNKKLYHIASKTTSILKRIKPLLDKHQNINL